VAAAENQLLARLPRRDRVRLQAVAESVWLEPGRVLCEPGDRMRSVYFPNDCFISLATAIDVEPALEVGMVGSEGMLGAQLALGVGTSGLHASVQGAGTAWRVDAMSFRRQLALSVALRRVLHRYLCVLMAQLATSATCTRFHCVEPRLARTLLMSQDRVHGDSFHLTHEVLARMLGARRVGITRAASELQRRRLISYHRGAITVIDRPGLERAACGCYAADLGAYARLLG